MKQLARQVNIPLLYIVILLLTVSLRPSQAAVPVIAPEHKVQIEKEQVKVSKPEWKEIWDTARQQARSLDMSEAKKSYIELLKIKPNIVEAKWEYCKLLILSGEWKAAISILDGLLELEPKNLDYLLAAGDAALKNNQYEKAVRYYGQVYEAEPFGNLSERAINGMITAFLALKKEQSALLMLEQYHLRKPDDTNILEQMAKISRKAGFIEKSRYYYSELVKLYPKKDEYVFAAAQLFDDSNHQEQAVKYQKAYLSLHDDYLPFHKKLAEFYIGRSEAANAIPHLLKLYRQDHLSISLALQIADLYYNALKRPDKALLYYEQYQKGDPSNKKIAVVIERIRDQLVQQYLPIIENNAAKSLWEDLELITLDKTALFQKIANFLQQTKRYKLEADVLLILHKNLPNELDITYRLAELWTIINNPEDAYKLYSELQDSNYHNKLYLLKKSELELGFGYEVKALHSLRRYLKFYPNDIQTILKALHLAGLLGLPQEVFKVWKNIPTEEKEDKDNNIALSLKYIEALRENGLYSFTDPIYTEILKSVKNSDQLTAQIYFHLAETLLEQELLFEAEQVIRQVLAKDIYVNRAIEKLIELSIHERQFSRARSWLSLLQERTSERLDKIHPIQLIIIELDILIAEGQFKEARNTLQIAKEASFHNISPGNGLDQQMVDVLTMYEIRIDYYLEDWDLCREKIVSYLDGKPNDKELLALYDLIENKVGVKSLSISKKNRKESQSYLYLYQKSKVFLKYKAYRLALDTIEQATDILPGSMTAKSLKVTLLTELALYADAIEIIDTMSSNYPEQEYFGRLRLQLEFKRGNFQKIVEKVGESKVVDSERQESNKADDNIYFWKKLLLARALWANNRRDEAIEVYDSLLAAPVDSMFLEKVEVEKINFHLPPLKKSFWNIITFTAPPEPDPITTVMAPEFVANNRGKPVDDIAASMYGKYRWQKLIRKELSARKAVEERDYYRAEKEYLSLLKEDESEETLFDLAGIYNRLGMYGKEAELYELMKKKSPLYPGLDEYISANVLKRQPRISSTFYSRLRKGRDGYINLKKKGFGVEGWLMPTYDQEISVSLFHNTYESYDDSSKSSSNRIIGTYSTYFEDSLDLNISFGTDRPSDGGTNEVLYKFELISRLNKSIDAYGRFEQDLVEDTMRSITDSIIYRDFEAGLKYDLFPRWFVGADYRYRLYSDDNQQNRYKIWSMYHLFGERNQFNLKYSYENIRHDDENVGREGNYRNIFRADDRVYWSPNHYWQHLFTVHFKHLFDGRSSPDSPLSYLSAEYSVGYEENFNVSHEFDMNIFLEINRHFLLKGNLRNHNGEDFERTEAGMSLIYRW